MRWLTLLLVPCCVALAVGASAPPEDGAADAPPARPKVPGKLRLQLRERKKADGGEFKAVERTADWEVAETAILVCDMWDDHHCKSAARRVNVMVPKMNEVLCLARDHGVQIIHAPSETMHIYEGTPYRERMKRAKAVKPPVPIERWCYLDPKREPPMPVDVSKCSCDDPVPTPSIRRWSRQHPGLDIAGFDGVSDRGDEIYNFLEQEGIKNVAIMGVHTNMCVLGRPFGIRQLVRLGKNVVLVRDLTDAMYDPRQPPYVSHARGTELVVEHIEKYWCPSVLSADLTRPVPGSDGPARDVSQVEK
jgi:nicotinamidase-related amidase